MWNGHNVADFIDPDIMAKLDQLEAEEDQLMQGGFYDEKMEENTDERKDIKKVAKRFDFISLILLKKNHEKILIFS